MASTGSIIQVIGSTFDAQFPEEDLPDIYNAVKCEVEVRGQKVPLTGEVAKHLGGGQVRCVALASTGRTTDQLKSADLVVNSLRQLTPDQIRRLMMDKA